MKRTNRLTRPRLVGGLLVLTVIATACGATKSAEPTASTTVPAIDITGLQSATPTTAPLSTGAKSSSDYCALFIDFSNWSLANLNSVMAEASEPTFAVRDAFFTEYLDRMAAMQKVEPAELHDALATFATYARLYLAHDLSNVAAHAKEMTPAAVSINGYGKTVCGYDPQVTTGG